MSVVLNVVFRERDDKPAHSLTEMCTDEDAALEAVGRIAANLNGYLEPALTAPLVQGWIIRDVPNATPITITEVVANYDVESAG